MDTVILQDIDFFMLTADYPSSGDAIPFSDDDLTIIEDQIDVGDIGYVRVIGGVAYEVIGIERLEDGSLEYSRGLFDTDIIDFNAGDCVVAYENAADGLQEDMVECPPITTETPDRLEITGDCGGWVVNFIEDDSDECTELTEAVVTPQTRILVEGCGYITVGDLCAAISE